MLIATTARHGSRRARRGSVLPFLVFTITVMVGFLALAIDLGMLAMAKAQAQSAADLAALTAARTLNGNSSSSSPNNGTYNSNSATTNAQNILGANAILGQTIQSSQLTLTYGSYDYSQTSQTFSANYPPTTGKPYTAVAATVTSNNTAGAFSNIFGMKFLPTVTATAQAVHRPRDVALVMDLSGSMRLGTCLGFDFYTSSRSTNNPDTVVPKFGHYATNSASLIGPSTNQTSNFESYTISPSNTTAANSSYSLTYVNSFYQNAAYASTLIRAFDSYSSTDGGNTWAAPTTQRPQLPSSSYATTPGGDMPLYLNGSSSTFATSVKDVLNSTTTNALWELDGYAGYSAGKPDTSGTGGVPKVWTQADYTATPFNGYTQGPGYYGKTFFLWPPDPRNGSITNTTTLKSYLNLIGVTNTTDQTTIANNWSTWLGQGSSGLTNLQNWLTGGSTKGGPYKTTGPFVPGSNNKAPVYYAVCRLFNRQYPAGSSVGAFSADWRARFFGTTSNNTLFNSSGSLNTPGSYTINYNAILSWITQSQDPFPTQMRAGRVKYYSSIPSSITGSWPSYGGTDQRFWVEFIDHVLGFRQTASGTYQDISAMAGYGSDITWGTVTINSAPTAPPYMNYQDNPARPLLRYWFGPMLMVDYLHNMNMSENGISGYFLMQSGDTYEAPIYSAKQAYVAAISTMQTNHPNDWVTVVPYSWPRTGSNGQASGSGSYGRFNCVCSPLGPNYTYATASLLFPFSTINSDGSCNNTEVTPYDADPSTSLVPSANFANITRGDGDTCFAMALMLAYNQFALTPSNDTTLRTFTTSTPIAFPNGMAGGLGRKGAQKVIIFETDGMANCSATANLITNGSYKYYQIRYDMNNPGSSEYPTINLTGINDSGVLNQVYSLITQLQTDYGTTRSPFRLYAIGFGPVFSGPDASLATSTLQNMQYYAGTQSSASTALSSSQIITGTDAQMAANMNTAFTNILQNGVQVALIK